MNNEMMNNVEIDKNFNKMVILLAEAYAKKCGMPKISEVVSSTGIKYEENQLYGAHIQAVQRLLIDEFKLLGLDLTEEVKKHNETFVIGKFSKYENDIIINKVINLTYYTNEYLDYRAKKDAMQG